MRTFEESSIDTKITPVYRKILVPLDGSKLAEQSLKHALAIVKSDKPATVVLLSVVEPITPGWFSPPGAGRIMNGNLLEELLEQKETEAKEYLAGLLTRLKNREINFQTVLTTGKAAEEIVEFAESHGIDIIIMSTRGRSGIGRWVMGSVTDQVMRSSRVPVLVIPPEPS